MKHLKIKLLLLVELNNYKMYDMFIYIKLGFSIIKREHIKNNQ